MRYSGIQPQYFPRLHYFARALSTDVFMLRDDCQFVRKHKYPDGKVGKSYQAHSPIKHMSGLKFLGVPIAHGGQFPISETKITYEQNWIPDQLKVIKDSYMKASQFESRHPEIESILKCNPTMLSDLNIATFIWGLSHLLGIPFSLDVDLSYINKVLSKQKKFRLQKIMKASDTEVSKLFDSMTANEKILALCKEVGATEDYCGGTAMAAYVDHNIFEKNNITITVQDWKCSEYPQQFTKHHGFIPNLSIIDLLMNVTRAEAVKIINA